MTFGIPEPSTDQGSETFLLLSDTIAIMVDLKFKLEDKHYLQKKRGNKFNGLTDLKETFKLNGETCFSLLAVEAHHSSLFLAASVSCALVFKSHALLLNIECLM